MTRYVAATITQTSYVTMCSIFLGLMEYVWLGLGLGLGLGSSSA